jgi:hypothetical protein
MLQKTIKNAQNFDKKSPDFSEFTISLFLRKFFEIFRERRNETKVKKPAKFRESERRNEISHSPATNIFLPPKKAAKIFFLAAKGKKTAAFIKFFADGNKCQTQRKPCFSRNLKR